MTRAKIIGVGAYAPKRILTNADLEKMVDTTDEWIVQRTGIRERHIVDESEAHRPTSPSAPPSRRWSAPTSLPRRSTSSWWAPPRARHASSPPPPTSSSTGSAAAAPARWTCCAACAGSVYSLSIGAQFIQTGKYRRVLCIGAETLSRITDFTDRGTCVLLADAAGAAVLEAVRRRARHHRHRSLLRRPVLGAALHAGRRLAPSRHPRDGRRSGMHYAKMKGNEVFKVAVRMFGECAERILDAQRLHGERRRPLHPAPGEPPHHRGRRQAPRGCRWSGCSSTWTATATPAPPRSTWRWRRRGRRAAQARRSRAHGRLRRRLHLGRRAAAMVAGAHRLPLPRPGLAGGRHGPRARRALARRRRGLGGGQRRPRLRPLHALLRGAGGRAGAHRQHPARRADRQRGGRRRAAPSAGCAPALAAGHSLGEYSALVVAGALALRRRRARSCAGAASSCRRRCRWAPGAMAALMGVELAAVEQVCAEAAQGEVVEVANINSPGQIVIAGHRAAVERAVSAGRGARRPEERAAPGERALPLRADDAGGRSPRRGAGAGRGERPAHPGRPQRGRGRHPDRRRGQAVPGPAGGQPGALDRLRAAAGRARAPTAFVEVGPGPRADRAAQAHRSTARAATRWRIPRRSTRRVRRSAGGAA